MPCMGGLKAHTRGGGWWWSPGPHPGGKLRGLVGGGGLQAHTQGGLQAHTWGWRLCIPACTEAAGSTHPTGMHSCFLESSNSDLYFFSK